MDIASEINAIARETGHRQIPAGDGRTAILRRAFDAPIEDVWDAITNPNRIRRWFLPVSGELRPGGAYQLEGNAGGTILQCEQPRRLRLTWVYGENVTERDISEVDVRLSEANGQTLVELDHAAVVDPAWWDQYGPGAVGVGWDLTMLGLSLHLKGESIGDPREWEGSAEAREFMTESSLAWGEALRASGATSEEVENAVRNTTAFYAPDPSGAEPADG
jgi:uncharacterized protein YndB with AHSA1/START domain